MSKEKEPLALLSCTDCLLARYLSPRFSLLSLFFFGWNIPIKQQIASPYKYLLFGFAVLFLEFRITQCGTLVHKQRWLLALLHPLHVIYQVFPSVIACASSKPWLIFRQEHLIVFHQAGKRTGRHIHQFCSFIPCQLFASIFF